MPIGAHIAPLPVGPTQRAATRRALYLDADGTTPGGERANVTVHNISAAGLLLESAVEIAVGQRLGIDLPGAGAVDASVVWNRDDLYGCAFDEPLEPAALAAVELLAAPRGRPRGQSEPLGVRLNRLRRESGRTLADIASALGVSKPTVWAWEKGKARPLPERLAAIAEVLGVDVEALAETESAFGDASSVIEECRARVAEACGVAAGNVRIMVEL